MASERKVDDAARNDIVAALLNSLSLITANLEFIDCLAKGLF